MPVTATPMTCRLVRRQNPMSLPRFAEHQTVVAGDSAQSQLLDGLRVDVAAAFDAPKPHAGG